MPFYASIGQAFVTMCAVIPVLFGVELLDQALHHRLDYDGGIRPRSLDGLDGMIFAPFLHANCLHLYGNSVPLILTGTFVLAGGGKRFLWVTAFIALISGLGVWLFAPVEQRDHRCERGDLRVARVPVRSRHRRAQLVDHRGGAAGRSALRLADLRRRAR